MPQQDAHAGHLARKRCNGGALNAQPRSENQHGVEHNVGDRANRHTNGRLHRLAHAPQQMRQKASKKEKGATNCECPGQIHHDSGMWIPCAPNRVDERVPQHGTGNYITTGDTQANPYRERRRTAGALLVSLSQGAGNHRRSSDAKQVGERGQQQHGRQADAHCSHEGRIADLTDEIRIGQIVENRDDLGEHGRHDEIGDRAPHWHLPENIGLVVLRPSHAVIPQRRYCLRASSRAFTLPALRNRMNKASSGRHAKTRYITA